MEADFGRILRDLGTVPSTSAGASGDGYVQVAKRVYLTGNNNVDYSQAFAMEGYNAVFVDCTVLAYSGSLDPFLNIYVQVSNDRQNWSTLPIGGSPAGLTADFIGYYKLDPSTIGQQVSAGWVRLKYETTGDIKVVCSIGLDRKRIGT